MAVIEKRGDGQFRARVRKTGFPPLSKTFINRSDAATWAKGIEVEMERGSFVTISKAQSTTFKDLADRYLKEVTPAKRSAASEKSRIAVLVDRFGPYFISSITREMVGQFRDDRLATPALRADRLRKTKPKNIHSRVRHDKVADLPRTLSPQSVIHELNTLSTMIEHARKEWSIQLNENPAHVSKPKRPDSRTRRLSATELQWLHRAADKSIAPGLGQVIVLAIETSMRLGELLGLRWSSINLQRRTAHLMDTKNGDSRTVALSTAAIAALRKVAKIQKAQKAHNAANDGKEEQRVDGRVFHWAGSDSFEKAWKRCVARAQAMYVASCEATGAKPQAGFLGDLRFHDLRHEAISRLVEHGLTTFEVSTMSGHKSLQMLKRYTHLEAEKVAAKLR
jgi:integrase